MGNYGYFIDGDTVDGLPVSDLACERHRADISVCGIEYRKEHSPVGQWERIRVTSAEGARSLGRPIGCYDTLHTDRFDLMDGCTVDDASDEIARELCRLCELHDILPEKILVVGLGNPRLSPDSLGPHTAERVKATMHIKDFDRSFFKMLECSEIAVTTPGVRAFSGMDSYTAISGLCTVIKPNLVIAIDSLSARSAERLGTAVQISDTGICAGSGIGNHATPIAEETLCIPVIGIGVPTVIDSRLLGGRAEGARSGADAGMLVSPKEICEIIDGAASVIAGGINQAFGLYS